MRFAGYAALFGTPDAAQDTVEKGAFQRTLVRRSAPLPLFWQHRPDQQIGWVVTASEDQRGLRIIAEIDNPDGKAATLLSGHKVSGLSFGYRARRYRKNGTGRRLEEIDLFEISLVTHPLQHGARVHMIA
ncbi:HK97 family phage prohead protease [Pontixanthobacter aquaemixtae]|uniref:HK97 family phage prohead protease n=1 Tax=Pontixanthobacter aquaemixtae TaxID=1958940 RepID=A0A845A0L9_9SPHN|nr:HK97 family phage prohead protease [Pontixanthobacter aquaemixtae]MXO91219.1 HK97 family phage prohead protease [Pontixanthobacter aquaemixtae]